jgi:hypothetical protein
VLTLEAELATRVAAATATTYWLITLTPTPSPESQQAIRYIVEHYGVSADDLTVVNEHTREYPLLGRTCRAFALFDGQHWFDLMIDLKDQTVIENIEAVEQAEERAAKDKYGKLDTALYERLQTMDGNDVVMVTIGLVAGWGMDVGKMQELAFATVAAKYPEARAAMEQTGNPMDLADPTLAATMDREYQASINWFEDQRKQELTKARQALAEQLKAQGIIAVSKEGTWARDIRFVLKVDGQVVKEHTHFSP